MIKCLPFHRYFSGTNNFLNLIILMKKIFSLIVCAKMLFLNNKTENPLQLQKKISLPVRVEFCHLLIHELL